MLRGLDLEVPRGTTLTVMGGSGSGKTVTLRLAAGLIKPDRGRITVLDIETTPLREEALLPLRKRMGFVFQGAALFDSLTAYENVAYPLREHARLRERRWPSGCTRSSRWSGSGRSTTSCRPSCRGACASGWASPAR